MRQSPHEQIRAAGFNTADTQMLIGVFDEVFVAHGQKLAIAPTIVDSLCMMAGRGPASRKSWPPTPPIERGS